MGARPARDAPRSKARAAWGVSRRRATGYDRGMTEMLPRPLLYVGLPALAGLFGLAVWAWARWGTGVFFDTLTGGMSTCL